MNKILTLSFFIIDFIIYSQSTVQRTEYFDWRKTKISHTWFELGDGTKHGSEKYYYENGKLELEYVWLKGDIKKVLAYYNDGTQRLISNHFNRWILDGEVKYYKWQDGTRFLQYNGLSKKVVNQDYDKVSLMEYNYGPNKKLFSYIDNGTSQQYQEYANSTERIYEPKTLGSEPSKITLTNGIISYGKCGTDEIVNGKFVKIGGFDENVFVKIEGDTVLMTEITPQDSTVYTKVISWNPQIELYPQMTVNPTNAYINFNLSFKIPGAVVSDKIFVVNENERYNDLSKLFNQYWESAYLDFGYYRKYSRLNKKLVYESFTTRENNSLILKYKKWFYNDGGIKEEWDGKSTKKYSPLGILIENIWGDSIKKYFENGVLALDSSSLSSKAYFQNGNIARELNFEINTVSNYSKYNGDKPESLSIKTPKNYKFYDSTGLVLYEGEIKFLIDDKNSEAMDFEKKLTPIFQKTESNLLSFKNSKIVNYRNEKSPVGQQDKSINFYYYNNIFGESFFKIYNALWDQVNLESVQFNKAIIPFDNINWNNKNWYSTKDHKNIPIESDQIRKDIYLNICLNYYSKAATILSQMDSLIIKFDQILNSPEKAQIRKALKKATTNAEIKTIIGI
jgi:hypothetical protein